MQEYLATLESQKNQNEKAIVSNVLAPFLQDLGFFPHSSYKQKGNSEIDLALLKDNQVEVIIEAKEPDSKEFFSKKNPNCKALHQCILYYLRERERGNINLNFIIITNFYEFYVFRASEFRRCFYKNKKIDNLYKILNQKGSQVENQTEFYEELSKILSKDFRGDREENLFNTTLKGTYFDLRNALQSTTHNAKQDSKESRQDSAPNPAQNTKQDDTELRIIAHILSKAFLHNEIQKDTNALNKGFYNELLHILGLEEFKQNNKTLIRFDTQKNSFATMIYKKLKDSPHNKSDEEAEESTMSHIIIWLNRVLFLKLIEANLLSFNDNNKSLRFLTSKKITRFSQLSHLFFEVLAKDYTQRGEDKGFAFLPYLNSSLFMYENAKEPLKISELDSDLCIELFTTSILKKQGELESSTHSMKFLSYLFDFLASYDFGKSPQNKENKEQETKELINSSVLGSVFEKLNGYKEGSFYTPSFITSYMCKESLSKIVCEKFNALNPKWKVKSLKDIKGEILAEIRDNRDKQEQIKERYTHLLKSIKICDPAVGSGHFLVAALNEMIKIHFELELFGSEILKLELHNDELIIKDKDNTDFAYKKPQSEEQLHHQIQKKLFTLKKEIIENNLFGVDINPNSCEIARLRLWIELLKHSYYVDFTDKHTHKLETLPNIDINIKCGNSLVSYFGINQSLTHYPNIKQKMQEYKNIVKDYKEGFYENKTQIDSKIKDLLETFRNFCFKDKFKKEVKAFEVKCENYSAKYGNYLAKDDKNLAVFISQRMFVDDFDESEALKAFEALKKTYDELFNLNSNKPFEWRFAFPEVLDSFGNFVGFDLIVGNPPYIRQEELKDLKPTLAKNYAVYKGTSDIYTYFYELGYKLLKKQGILSFITSNKYTRAGYGEPLRDFLLQNTSLLSYTELNGIKIFENATVDTSILSFEKAKSHPQHTFTLRTLNKAQDLPNDLNAFSSTQMPQNALSKEAFIFSDLATQNLKNKIESLGTPLKSWDISINYGIKTGYNEAFIIDTNKKEQILKACDDSPKSHIKGKSERERTTELIKPILRGRDIKRYSYEWAGLWIINTHNGYTIDNSSLGSFCGSLDLPHCEAQESASHSSNPTQPTKSPQDTRIVNAKDENKQNITIKIPPVDIGEYPTLKAYFDEVAKQDKGKGKGFYNRDDKGKTPYNLRNCAYINEFAKPKIVYSEIVREPQFYLDNGEFKFGHFYAEATSFILTGEHLEYLLGILHSKLATFAFKNFYAGGGLGESGYRYKKAFLEKLPIPKINKQNEKLVNQIIALVDEILKSKEKDTKADTSTLENQIDNLVYKLYNLSENEIKIIKGEC